MSILFISFAFESLSELAGFLVCIISYSIKKLKNFLKEEIYIFKLFCLNPLSLLNFEMLSDEKALSVLSLL